MTTNYSLIYDQIILKLEELFPYKTRIPYPYSLQDNNKNLLSDGYGLIIGPANFEALETCNRMVAREVSVVVTREVFRTDSDAVVIDNIVKALGEDINLVQGLFYAYNELGIEPNIARVDIVSSSGVDQVIGDKSSFLSMTGVFNFYITESL